ncbi:MAG: type II toxin-antitoxin system VapC family toxin [Proteobacteria bacterium]|nr:type II toxin-antitoxin system VapC family toxin [Pseudomonadota bacterium]
MKRIILDTNAYSKLLTGNDNVLDIVASADVIFMSIFVLGELHAGFKGGTKNRENQSILKRFLTKPSVKILLGTSETAEVFGGLMNMLKKAGTPLPINDVWIAAHAIETGSVIVTYDLHFRKISGIRLWDPI